MTVKEMIKVAEALEIASCEPDEESTESAEALLTGIMKKAERKVDNSYIGDIICGILDEAGRC